MIKKGYNEKFSDFFERFTKEYEKVDTEGKEMLFELAVEFVERNRDFVMQYPLVEYWKKIEDRNILQDLLRPYENQRINLYFHIPFCKTRCTYCNFHIVVGDKNAALQEALYIETIEKEIDEFCEKVKDYTIDSVFIGGGTPSYLSPKAMERLLGKIRSSFSPFFSPVMEYTFEGNPDSFSEEKFTILKNFGVNRLSLGIQTFEDDILKHINRTYDEKIVYRALELARLAGFSNINIDMIYGLPGSDHSSMVKDLKKASETNVSHITYYPLYYYEDAILNKSGKRENNIREIYSFYDEVVSSLVRAGFVQYGREYFAKNGAIHHYQNNYVSNGLLYGFGHSAYSFNGREAFYKNQNFSEYLRNHERFEKRFHYSDDILDRRLFVLGSRNIRIKKVNINNIEATRKNLKLPIDLKLIQEDSEGFVLTEKGLKYQEILSHMLL